MRALTRKASERLLLVVIGLGVAAVLMVTGMVPAGAALVDPSQERNVRGDACHSLEGFSGESFSFSVPQGDDDDDDDDEGRVFERTFHLVDGATLYVNVAANRKTMDFEVTDATVDAVFVFSRYDQRRSNLYDYRSLKDPVTADTDLEADRRRSIKRVSFCYQTKANPTINVAADEPTTVEISDTSLISATAVLAGGEAPGPAITFALYSDNGCHNEVLAIPPVAVSDNGSFLVEVATATTGVGTFYWGVVYPGDDSNNPADDCGDASTVNPATPTLSVSADETDVVIGDGVTVSASATLDGGYLATGTISFALYTNSECAPASKVADVAATGPVVGDGTYSSLDVATGMVGAGTYYWGAAYSSGEDPNNVDTTDCGAMVTVNPEDPTLVVSADETDVVKDLDTISASATLSGGFGPGGSIVFALYEDSECTIGTGVEVPSVAVSGNATYPSDDIGTGTLAVGTYYWGAMYGGDNNNNPASDCGAAVQVYEEGIACEGTSSAEGIAGDAATDAFLTRGRDLSNPEDPKDSCLVGQIPVTFEIGDEIVSLDFPTNATFPGARFLVRIDWNPDDLTVDPLNPPIRQVDYTVNGTFVTGVACTATTAPTGTTPSVIYDYTHPPGAPVCLAGQEILLTSDGKWQQIQYWDVLQDPRWK